MALITSGCVPFRLESSLKHTNEMLKKLTLQCDRNSTEVAVAVRSAAGPQEWLAEHEDTMADFLHETERVAARLDDAFNRLGSMEEVHVGHGDVGRYVNDHFEVNQAPLLDHLTDLLEDMQVRLDDTDDKFSDGTLWRNEFAKEQQSKRMEFEKRLAKMVHNECLAQIVGLDMSDIKEAVKEAVNVTVEASKASVHADVVATVKDAVADAIKALPPSAPSSAPPPAPPPGPSPGPPPPQSPAQVDPTPPATEQEAKQQPAVSTADRLAALKSGRSAPPAGPPPTDPPSDPKPSPGPPPGPPSPLAAASAQEAKQQPAVSTADRLAALKSNRSVPPAGPPPAAAAASSTVPSTADRINALKNRSAPVAPVLQPSEASAAGVLRLRPSASPLIIFVCAWSCLFLTPPGLRIG